MCSSVLRYWSPSEGGWVEHSESGRSLLAANNNTYQVYILDISYTIDILYTI